MTEYFLREIFLVDRGNAANIAKIRTSTNLVLHGVSNVTQPPSDRHTTAARQGTYLPVLECLVTGPHIRTVPSSLDEAIIVGSLGFQLTQFTVLVCPLSTATGFSRFECQMYTLLSKRHSSKLLDAMYMYRLITKREVNRAGN